jgi:hypothetical protein
MHRSALALAIVAALVLPAHAESAGWGEAGRVGTARAGAAREHSGSDRQETWTPLDDDMPPTPTDSVWVFTNRAHDDGEWQERRGPLAHLVRAYRVTPVRPDPVSFEVRLDVQPAGEQRLGGEAMLEAVRRAVHGSPSSNSPTDRAVVLHVHGYATSLDEATEEAAEMRQRGGFTGPMAVFAWPARSVGMTWPSAGRLLTSGYWQDSAAAAESAADLARVLHDLVGAVGADRVVVSAHSMGNQLLAATLVRDDVRALLRDAPLRAIAFVSPDVDRAYFATEVVPSARPLADRLVLYGARDDHMLRLSAHVVHDGQPRAGLFDAAMTWPDGLEVVDITEGRVAAPWFGPWFDTNHALRRHATALTDLFRIVAGDAPPESRSTLGIMARDARGAWQALDAPLPERPWMVERTDALTSANTATASPR